VLLGDDDAPWMILTAVHDVLEPPLGLERERTALASLAHRDVDIDSTVVDEGDGANEILMSIN